MSQVYSLIVANIYLFCYCDAVGWFSTDPYQTNHIIVGFAAYLYILCSMNMRIIQAAVSMHPSFDDCFFPATFSSSTPSQRFSVSQSYCNKISITTIKTVLCRRHNLFLSKCWSAQSLTLFQKGYHSLFAVFRLLHSLFLASRKYFRILDNKIYKHLLPL